MKIKIEFLNGSDYWKDLVTRNAEIASRIMNSEEFLAGVSQEVEDKIDDAGEVTIKVGFFEDYRTKAIASEGDGIVNFNTAKEAEGAGSPGNIAHETMHTPKFGYRHRWGNWRWLNKRDTAYTVGYLVDEIAGKEVSRIPPLVG